MTRMIHCKKLDQELEALETPPFPGPLGERIYNEISKAAWENWMRLQTRIVNEYQLDMHKDDQRDFILRNMKNHFFGQDETESKKNS